MKPTIIIVHGGNSFKTNSEFISSLNSFSPRFKDGYNDWKTNLALSSDLSEHTLYPLFPSRENAHYNEWCIVIQKVLDLPQVSDDIILIGHSLGAIFLQSYISENILSKHIIQLHFISPCLSVGDFILSDNWINIEKQCNSIHIYHSTDDHVVNVAEAQVYKANLSNSELHLMNDRGHFNQPHFPEIMDILKQNYSI